MTDTIERPSLKVVGTRPVRPDGVDKVTGKANYGADFAMPGMLVGKIKRSPHAHARIVSLDTRRAEALRGVKAVIVGTDMPVLGASELAMGEHTVNISHIARNVIASGKVVYDGQAVAAVAATSAAIALQALDLIDIVYEVLPHVIDVEEAMRPDAPLLHDDIFTEGLESKPEQPSNIAKEMRLTRGDVAAAFDRADVLIEDRYTTAAVHQGYIEPHACVASVGADGQAVVWCSSQGQFMVRTFSAAITGMDQADIRVIPAEIGGGFGGKTTVYLEPLALLLSKRAGRPVKMVMDREEVFRASGPTSASVMYIKIGATSDGKITGIDLQLKFQAGAFPGSPMFAAVLAGLAPYDLSDFVVTGWDVVTNTPKVAAYRAPGAPIAAFAIESALDDLARKLDIDPIELRVINGVRDGVQATYGPTFSDIGFMETLEAIRTHPHYAAPLGPNQGRGVAAGYWFNAAGESSASVSITEDGAALVATGSPDIGGSRASMGMMAAEVLGLPIERVRSTVADTASIPFAGLTGGSRVTFATGITVTEAAQAVVEQLKARAALTWGVAEDQVEWRDDGTAVCLDPEQSGEILTLAQLAGNAGRTGGPISAQVARNVHGAAPAFAVHLCDVEVDQETGQARVVRYTAAQDVGRAIHPSYVEGQVQGGVAQGIGWALNEEYVFNRDGRMENPGFLDYRMPVASDLPMIDAVLIEVPNPHHPFGAKGVGEVPIVPPLAAIANAVRDATGRRFFDLPLSPPRIHAALNGG